MIFHIFLIYFHILLDKNLNGCLNRVKGFFPFNKKGRVVSDSAFALLKS